MEESKKEYRVSDANLCTLIKDWEQRAEAGSGRNRKGGGNPVCDRSIASK